MELINRIELENDFAAKLNKLNASSLAEQILSELGGTLDHTKITPELWQRVKDEYDREMKASLFLLMLLSMDTHTVRTDMPWLSQSYRQAAEKYAAERTSVVMPRFLLHSQNIITRDAPRWTLPGHVDETLDKVFGEQRADKVAKTETSAAQTDGGAAAIRIQGLHVKFRWEHSRVRPHGHAGAAVDPCKICTPMLGKWHYEWNGLVPGKIHQNCDCYGSAYDVLTGQPLPFEYPVEETV